MTGVSERNGARLIAGKCPQSALLACVVLSELLSTLLSIIGSPFRCQLNFPKRPTHCFVLFVVATSSPRTEGLSPLGFTCVPGHSLLVPKRQRIILDENKRRSRNGQSEKRCCCCCFVYACVCVYVCIYVCVCDRSSCWADGAEISFQLGLYKDSLPPPPIGSCFGTSSSTVLSVKSSGWLTDGGGALRQKSPRKHAQHSSSSFDSPPLNRLSLSLWLKWSAPKFQSLGSIVQSLLNGIQGPQALHGGSQTEVQGAPRGPQWSCRESLFGGIVWSHRISGGALTFLNRGSLKGKFTPQFQFTPYLLTTMPMEGWVKCLSPQNTFGVSVTSQ